MVRFIFIFTVTIECLYASYWPNWKLLLLTINQPDEDTMHRTFQSIFVWLRCVHVQRSAPFRDLMLLDVSKGHPTNEHGIQRWKPLEKSIESRWYHIELKGQRSLLAIFVSIDSGHIYSIDEIVLFPRQWIIYQDIVGIYMHLFFILYKMFLFIKSSW